MRPAPTVSAPNPVLAASRESPFTRERNVGIQLAMPPRANVIADMPSAVRT